MDFEQLLAHYREHDEITDEELTRGAITSAEQYFEIAAQDENLLDKLLHHSRIEAMLYLALKAEQKKNNK